MNAADLLHDIKVLMKRFDDLEEGHWYKSAYAHIRDWVLVDVMLIVEAVVNGEHPDCLAAINATADKLLLSPPSDERLSPQEVANKFKGVSRKESSSWPTPDTQINLSHIVESVISGEYGTCEENIKALVVHYTNKIKSVR